MTPSRSSYSELVAQPKHADEPVALYHIYRRSPAQPGDHALCGHVKPHGWISDHRNGNHPDLCVVCDQLYESERR